VPRVHHVSVPAFGRVHLVEAAVRSPPVLDEVHDRRGNGRDGVARQLAAEQHHHLKLEWRVTVLHVAHRGVGEAGPGGDFIPE